MKKRKMHFIDILSLDINFYDFRRYQNANSENFTAYFLTDFLTEEKKEYLKSNFNNIEILKSQSQYAPEQKHQVLAVYDKVLKIGGCKAW